MILLERLLLFKLIKVLLLTFFCCDKTSGNRQCGKIISPTRSGKLQGKIVGGYDVGYYKYPWFAALQILDETMCGGALIGPNYVLTAAHCFDAYVNSQKKLENVYKIKMGLYNSCKKEPTQKVFNVAKVHIHEKYPKNKPYYDIAILQLSGNTTAFESICLPPKKLSDAEQEAEGWIIGLGNMVEGGNAYPCEMHEGRILIYDSETCFDMLKKLSQEPSELKYINAICAGYKAGGVDSCQGDSGGPLMTLNSLTNTWQSVGITSFGYGCGDKNAMGIYTDVSQYLDWIEKISGIKPADEYVKEPDLDNDGQVSVNSNNFIADTFNAIYDHVMNNQHAPKEIVIRFKNKQVQSHQKQKAKSIL